MSDQLLWNEIGNLHLKMGSIPEAIAAYSKAIELGSEPGMPCFNLGNAFFMKGDYGQALFMYRKSIQYMDTPKNQAAVWNKIGDTYRAINDIDNAILAYKKADGLGMEGSKPGQNELKQSLEMRPSWMGKVETAKPKPDRKPLGNPISEARKEPVINDQAHAEFNAPANDLRPINSEKKESNSPLPITQPETKSSQFIKGNRNTDSVKFNALTEPIKIPSRMHKDPDVSLLPKEKSIIVIPDFREKSEIPSESDKSQRIEETTKGPEPSIKQNDFNTGRKNVPSSATPGIDNLEEVLAKVNIYENITQVNPTNDRAWDTLGKLYKLLGRYQDAIGAYGKAIEMAPEREVYYYYLGLLYSVELQDDDAVNAFEQVLQKNPDYILAHSALAGVYRRMGQESKANHHIAIALPKMSNESTYNRACFYAICGDNDLAFEFLRLALQNRDTTMEWIKSDPDLDPIRTDPRYQELISDKDQPELESKDENYFSSALEGKQNRLLPLLNNSLAR